MGEEPVGRPSTNGRSGVGLKSLILSGARQPTAAAKGKEKVRAPLADVVADVLADGGGVVADDETWREGQTAAAEKPR